MNKNNMESRKITMFPSQDVPLSFLDDIAQTGIIV
jgi:hypothetical protein